MLQKFCSFTEKQIKKLTSFFSNNKHKGWVLLTKINIALLKAQNIKALNFLKAIIKNTIVTIATLLLMSGVIFYNLTLPFQNNEGILIAIGAAITTALILVFSLSIIPVQRASETWSPAILRIYKRDRRIFWQFIFMSIAATFTFIFSMKNYLYANYILLGSFVLLAVTLDLLRWHYAHICTLIDPKNAINTLKTWTIKTIMRYKKMVDRNAILSYNSLAPSQKKAATIEQYKEIFYKNPSAYNQNIRQFINELTELTARSLERSELVTSSNAIHAFAEITQLYLECRCNNLYPPMPLPFFDNYTDNIFDHILMSLNRINEIAVAKNYENISIKICDTLISIIESLLKINNRTFLLFYLPFAYLQTCIEKAKHHHLDEVALQSTGMLLELIKAFPNLDANHIYKPIIHLLNDAARYFIKSKSALANIVNDRILIALNYLLAQRHPQFSQLLPDTLKSFALFTRIALALDISKPFQSSPIESIYANTSQNSLSYLLKNSSVLILKDSSDPRDPYYYFIDVSENIRFHLMQIATENEFGNNICLTDIINTINDCINFLIILIKNPVREGSEQNLAKEVGHYLDLLPFFFYKKNTISFLKVLAACKNITLIGNIFSDIPWHAHEIIIKCGNSIKAIIDSCYQMDQNVNLASITKLLILLQQLKTISNEKGYKAAAEKLERLILEKPKDIDNAKWEECLTTFKKETEIAKND